MKTNIYIYIYLSYLSQFFLEWKTLRTKVEEKSEIHVLCLMTFFSENRAIHEIMWKYLVEMGRP